MSEWADFGSSPSREEEEMARVKAQHQMAAFDRRVLDGISVAALLAAAVFFLWLIR